MNALAPITQLIIKLRELHQKSKELPLTEQIGYTRALNDVLDAINSIESVSIEITLLGGDE